MGKPLTIQIEDDYRLEFLKKTLGASSKVEVLRRALDSLEQNLIRQKKMHQWKKAAELVAHESVRVNREFQKHSRLKHL